MLSGAPILVDDIRFHRGRRGVQPASVILSDIRRAVLLLGIDGDSPERHAWTDLLADAAHLSSGDRPDAVWMDGNMRDAPMLCKDGYPANARRGLFGLTASEFALYHVRDTTTDIHNMYANAAAFIHLAYRRFGFDPLSEEAVRASTDAVLADVRHGETVRGFLFRNAPVDVAV